MTRRSMALTLLLFTACSESPTAGPKPVPRTRPLVFATIHPLQYFVTQLAGEWVDCELALPPGENPQHWVPDRATLARLATADLVVLQGAKLEPWQDKVGLPRSRRSIVCTGWSEQLIKIKDAITHTHGGKAHTHDGIDPFVWLDLDLAAQQAGVVARALQRLLPARAAAITEKLGALQVKLSTERLAQADVGVPGKRLCSVSRVYDYWARSCGLTVLYLDLHDEAGIAKARAAVSDLACKQVLCSAPPDGDLLGILGELGLEPVVFDPCFTVAEGQDFLKVMVTNRKRLENALAGE